MPVFRFGAFQLDPARRELLRDRQPVTLAPRAFDVIAYLLAHRDRAVGRDELISAVWGRADVSDNVLDQVVLKARRALDDLVEPRHSIATRPRFGFAWVAPVEVVEGSAGEAAAAPADPPQPPATASVVRPWRSPVLVAALLLLALAAGWMAWPRLATDRSAASGQATGGGATSSADATLVLPFAVDPAAQADWTRLGLMDLVGQRLRDAGVHTLRSENAVALMRDLADGPDAELQPASARELAARAGATRVVQGRVVLREGRWQVALRAEDGNGDTLEAEGMGADPLQAARQAADQLALAMGRQPAGVALPQDPALALRLQQVDALVLGDALDAARAELATLPAAYRDDPAVRLREATLRFRGGALDEAAGLFEALLADVSASDAPHLHGTVQSALGNLALRRGDAAEAARRGQAAIAALAQLPPSAELGRAYTGRAIARSTLGQYADALQDFALARVVLDAVGDRVGVARVDINVGILEARRDHLADAAPLLVAGADRLAAFNDLTNELFARVTLARTRLALLDPAGALEVEARLAQLVALEPNPERRRYANLARVEVLAANGRMSAAGELLQAVREEASAEGDIVLLGVAQSIAAGWLLHADPAAAAREAQTALNAPWAEEDPRQFAATWRLLVRSRLAEGDASAARAALAGLDAWSVEQPASIQAQRWLAHAEFAAATGEPAAAAADYEKALQAADAARVPADLLAVTASYAPWLVAAGDGGRATAVAGRTAAFAERHYDAAVALAGVHRALGHVEAAEAALASARRLAGERRLPAPTTPPSS